MIVSDAFRGKNYAVLGLARSGLATVRALIASGAKVTAWDSNEAARADVGTDVTLADLMEIDLAGFDALVVSPGVPINRHPIADKARAAHVPIIGDIELFAEARASLPPHIVVGITGTNGKSTTTALIHHLCVTAGRAAMLGGNIGLPILGQTPLPAGGVYVLELSSYQIDLSHSLACDISVLTNITPDHLDRYDGFAGYCASKQRLFNFQHVDQLAIIACDDDPSRMIASRINHRLIRVHAADIHDQSRWPTLQGPHNAQNVAIAIKVAQALGIDDAMIEQGLATYPGLPHRMQRVKERAGVLYVNDSKATNPDSTAPALGAYPAIHWILGGVAKTDSLHACERWFGNVRAAYVIGEAAPLFEKLLSPFMSVTVSGTLEQAVRDAAAVAVAGETVLLSPACASFDQFRDFEARGDAFVAAVESL
ncbi:UDP-N-acetylmuramoyl-L-alanine--D-glutamate ligase [Aquisediminimonas sediminicola]|uniref:UDP-N-acetylmuramoyl-L-alanine--D-glutamate ligase n=1 Tax=Alteraquisediminimonas sediminicola TaxID=2676787 RepID=UPI001C8E8FB7